MAKKKRRPERKPERKPDRPRSPQFLDRLDEVEALLRRGKWLEARDRLTALDQRHPQREEVLRRLAHVHQQLRDGHAYQAVLQQLVKLQPNDPDLALALGGACLTNAWAALALQTFQWFLQRWSDHPQAGRVHQTVAELEPMLAERLADLGLTGPDGLEVAALHEQVQSFLNQGKYARARATAEEVLRRLPQFVPTLNNAGEAWFRDGHPQPAIEMARRVLAIAPENHHALSNLTRYLCLSGQLEEARAVAQRLKALATTSSEVAVKKAEALTYLGDDQGILQALREAEATSAAEGGQGDGLLYHLAAVAAFRLGREAEAQSLWKQALRYSPGLDLARENLEDLKRPAEKRHAPWPYSLPYWITRQTIDALMASFTRVKGGKEGAVQHEVRRYLKAHPELAILVPLLLDRGDPAGRQFAMHLANAAQTPELLQALCDFALSQRGPDDLRMQAAQTASKAGLLPAGKVRFWLRGEWAEILMFGFELHGEALPTHPPEVDGLARAARDALHRGDGKEAERLLKQALEKAPDVPALLNNLGNAYQAQGKDAEVEALLREVHQRHPNYLFGRTGMAKLLVREGKLDEARDLLEPLLARRRLHFSEFAALADAQLEVILARGDRESARSWLRMWEQAYPDHPQLRVWRSRLRSRGRDLGPFEDF